MQRTEGGIFRDSRLGLPRGLARGVGIERGEGVEARFKRFDAGENGVDDFDGRQFAVPDQARHVDGGRVAEVVVVHKRGLGEDGQESVGDGARWIQPPPSTRAPS